MVEIEDVDLDMLGSALGDQGLDHRWTFYVAAVVGRFQRTNRISAYASQGAGGLRRNRVASDDGLPAGLGHRTTVSHTVVRCASRPVLATSLATVRWAGLRFTGAAPGAGRHAEGEEVAAVIGH